MPGRSKSDLKLRLLQDLLTYCLPCLLRYEDRNAMAFSVESRVPYLDQELVEYVLSLPDTAIIKNGWSRWILRAGLKGTLPEKIRLRRWKVGFTTPEMRWIKARRAAFTSLYQSPTFQARPYWHGDGIVEAFRACCRGDVEESPLFWRAANVELWLREFCDGSVVLEDADIEAALTAPAEIGPKHRGDVPDVADARTPALLASAAGLSSSAGAAEAQRLLDAYKPNALKHLFAATAGRVYARLPIRTDVVRRGDDLAGVILRHVAPHVRPGDSIAIAENAVSAAQGRSFLHRGDPPHAACARSGQGGHAYASRARPWDAADDATGDRPGRSTADRRGGRGRRGRPPRAQAWTLLQGRRP